MSEEAQKKWEPAGFGFTPETVLPATAVTLEIRAVRKGTEVEMHGWTLMGEDEHITVHWRRRVTYA